MERLLTVWGMGVLLLLTGYGHSSDTDVTLSAALILGLIFIVELVIGIGLLVLFFYSFQKSTCPSRRKQVIFIVLGVLLVSPAIVPAGTLAIIPLPLGMLLVFIRSLTDAMFLLKTWWFVLPSMLITGLVCRYVARRLFSARIESI